MIKHKGYSSNHDLHKSGILSPCDKIGLNIYRFQTIMVTFAICFLVLTIRLFDIVLLHGPSNTKQVANNNSSQYYRSEIVDRNGVLLAVNLATASLYANPKVVLDAKEAAQELSKIFTEIPYNQLLADLSSKKNFVWIKRNITPKEQFAVNNLGLPGLFFEKADKRIYPHGPLLSHLIGYVGIDGHGLAGIEKSFDKYLSEKNDIQPNSPLALSIDVRAQGIVNEELINAMEEFKAIGAVGIVMDVNNGEVLSSVSLPNFDPHNPGNASADQLFNRFSLGLYEPGSTFKTYTMAMALDSEAITMNNSYDVNSPIRSARFSINDYHAKGGSLTVPEIFMYSSNIGTAKISLDLGKSRQQSYLKQFGFLDAIELEIPEKATPLYPSFSKWSELSMMTISYGHGIAVTPFHLIKVASAMINGGILNPITVLKRDDQSKINRIRIIKESTSEQIRKLFRLVVEQGTGKKANIEGYVVGGKTGTADKAHKGRYKQNARLSTFIAAFPMHQPKYMVLVMLDEPQGNQSTGGYATAGMTAAPVAGKIISRLGTLFGMQAYNENAPEIKHKLMLEQYINSDELNSF